MSKISLIIEREYLTRVQKKSFILMTILSPIIMVALVFAPIWLSSLSSDETRLIAVIDQTGLYKDVYHSSDEYRFTYTQGSLSPEQMRIDGDESTTPYAYVIIKDNLLDNPQGMTIYSQKQITASCELEIISQMEDYLKDEKLLSYNIPDIKRIIDESNISLRVDTIRLEEDGAETQTSTEVVTIIGMAMTLIIYMFLMLYGGQVMSSVMQEKTNRIVEVMVSSVKPFELMIGKITSIGLVGLTQLGIWIIFLVGIFLSAGAYFSMSGGVDPSQINDMAAMTSGMSTIDTAQLTGEMGAMAEIQQMLGSINITQLLICFVLFFIGGYILYASLFAAIGSAVDNESDTQQFMVPITFIIIFALYAGIFSAENPDGPLALWCSMIPFTSPIVMMVRIPFGVSTWELVLSMVILYGSAIGLAWVAGRIYRVGILMYGKKPSYKEMIKWIRYKA
ncbi:ABC transporter permease [Barnesiella viscericola DSM 18177]|uniref:ABC transporter permease n=1 Tax=Barnesiella viscericola DSM 18177 TaxID=880074 RepID=W0ERH8_9BACT|nr:ABC transporter permease [Barnesiella viscericola]AHF11799.1 ABC transporter permease [Barnesiella viscericola DSM 18177]